MSTTHLRVTWDDGVDRSDAIDAMLARAHDAIGQALREAGARDVKSTDVVVLASVHGVVVAERAALAQVDPKLAEFCAEPIADGHVHVLVVLDQDGLALVPMRVVSLTKGGTA